MTDPCGGSTKGGEGCTCDPPFSATVDSNGDEWAIVDESFPHWRWEFPAPFWRPIEADQ